MAIRKPRTPARDDPNQAPGGQNKPQSQGGLAGQVSGDRNVSNNPGFDPARKKDGRR